jgi:hypothetical protein
LSIQNSAGLGRSLGQGSDSDWGLWGQLGLSPLTRAAVARLRFAAAGADAPQLLGGLIKKEVRVVGHGCSLGMTIHPVSGAEKQAECGLCTLFIQRVFKDMRPGPGSLAGN